MLVAAAVYGGWKGVSLLVARERGSSRKLLRYLWPTVMLDWCWFMLWATSFPSSSRSLGKSLNRLLILFFAIDLPGAVVGNRLLGIPIDWPGPAKGAAASGAGGCCGTASSAPGNGGRDRTFQRT